MKLWVANFPVKFLAANFVACKTAVQLKIVENSKWLESMESCGISKQRSKTKQSIFRALHAYIVVHSTLDKMQRSYRSLLHITDSWVGRLSHFKGHITQSNLQHNSDIPMLFKM